MCVCLCVWMCVVDVDADDGGCERECGEKYAVRSCRRRRKGDVVVGCGALGFGLDEKVARILRCPSSSSSSLSSSSSKVYAWWGKGAFAETTGVEVQEIGRERHRYRWWRGRKRAENVGHREAGPGDGH